VSWPPSSPSQQQFPPQQFPPPGPRPGPSQALAVVALVGGILSLVLIAVFGPFAIPFGIAAVVTGLIALVKRHPGRGMAIAGLVTGAVGVVVNVVLTVVLVALYGGLFFLGASGALDGFDSDSSSSSPFDEFGDDPGEDDGYTGDLVGDYAFGDPVDLDDYTVSVDGVETREDVVFADLTVQYTGTTAGDSYYDLFGYLYDGVGQEYDATDCWAELSTDAADLPDLTPGQTVSFQMCFDGVGAPEGSWVQVVDGGGLGSYANWTDQVTLEGPSSTGV
jgi:hypothetical protein